MNNRREFIRNTVLAASAVLSGATLIEAAPEIVKPFYANWLRYLGFARYIKDGPRFYRKVHPFQRDENGRTIDLFTVIAEWRAADYKRVTYRNIPKRHFEKPYFWKDIEQFEFVEVLEPLKPEFKPVILSHIERRISVEFKRPV